jgi:hypothetical protein
MYLIPSNPTIYNRKWDCDHTQYSPAGVPVIPAGPPSPPTGVPSIYRASPAIQYVTPTPTPCAACNCSPRGISTPPQKRLGQLGQAPGVPAGTVLAYSAVWKQSTWRGNVGWNDPNGVQSAIQDVLASQWGIVVDAQQHSTNDYINTTGQSGFVLQVHTTSDYGAQDDIKSVIDGAIYAIGQEMPQSTIRIVQTGVSPSATNPNALYPASIATALAAAQAGLQDAQSRGDTVSAAQFAAQIQQLTGQNPLGPGANLTSWLSNNWGLLAAAGVGAVVLREVL